jgi:hypothetical protein
MHRLSVSRPLCWDVGTTTSRPGTIGIEHEGWHAEARRRGTTVIVSVVSSNPRSALAALAASDAPMDTWFKDEVRTLTGEEFGALFA